MMSSVLHESVGADDSEQLVVFELANEYYGVDIGVVNTIIRKQEITAIPCTQDYIEGVINLRGSIIPVINMRKRFEFPVGETTKASRIVVVEVRGQLIGVTVDAVAETLKLSPDAIEPPSPVISSLDSDFLRGIGKQENRLVILLDLDKALSSQDMKYLSQARKDAENLTEPDIAA